MGQEKQCDLDIEKFVKEKFKIDFKMFSKIEVNGDDCHPLYKFLRRNSTLHDPKTGTTKEVPWNFAKFLVNSEGKVVGYYSSDVKPNTFRPTVEELLS